MQLEELSSRGVLDSISRSKIRETLRDLDSNRLAVLVVYEQADPVWSIRNFCFSARASGFEPLIVVNGIPSVDFLSDVGSVAPLISRPNFGHDFAVYRDVFLEFTRRDQDSDSRLVLANDSVFYPDDFSAAFEEVIDLPSDLSGLTMSLSPVFHIQSYFLRFGPRALSSAGLAAFWEGYQSTSVRSRVIRCGEVALTQCALREGLTATPLSTASRVSALLREARIGISDVNSWQDSLSPYWLQVLLPSPGGQQWNIEDLVLADSLNPTHVWGILLSNLLAVPLKKDLWKTTPIGFILGRSRRYSQAQLADMGRVYDARLARQHSLDFWRRADSVAGN